MEKLIKTALSQVEQTKSLTEADSGHLDADFIAAFFSQNITEDLKIKALDHADNCERCRRLIFETAKLESAGVNEVVEENASSPFVQPKSQQVNPLRKLAFAFAALVVLLAGVLIYSIFYGTQRNINVAKENPQYDALSEKRDENGEAAEIPQQENSLARIQNSNISVSNSKSDTNALQQQQPDGPDSLKQAERTAVDPIRAGNQNDENRLGEDKNRDTVRQNPPENDNPNAFSEAQNLPARPAAKTPEVSGNPAAAASPNRAVSNKERTVVAGQPSMQTDDEISPSEPRSDSSEKKAMSAKLSPKQKDSSRGVEKQALGKTFYLRNQVWYDAQYDGRSVKAVKKSGSEFEKLPDEIKRIVNTVGTPIVILWDKTAYKIY
jgi:hypothetical protein